MTHIPCPKCGTSIAFSGQTCAQCGYALTAPESEHASNVQLFADLFPAKQYRNPVTHTRSVPRGLGLAAFITGVVLLFLWRESGGWAIGFASALILIGLIILIGIKMTSIVEGPASDTTPQE